MKLFYGSYKVISSLIVLLGHRTETRVILILSPNINNIALKKEKMRNSWVKTNKMLFYVCPYDYHNVCLPLTGHSCIYIYCLDLHIYSGRSGDSHQLLPSPNALQTALSLN